MTTRFDATRPARGARRSRGAKNGRVLLIGFGARGRQWLRECADAKLEIAGIVDPDPNAASAAQAAGIPAWSRLGDAIAASGVDAAIVASPPGDHVRDSIACVEAGIAVLVEKPLALSVDQARELERRAREARIRVLVGQNFRFLPRERAVRALLADGRIGAPVSVDVISARPSTAAAPHLVSVENGPLWDIALHHLDTFRTRFGEPEVVDASPRGGSRVTGQTEILLRLTWAHGLQLDYHHIEGAPAFHHHEWIAGEAAGIVVDGESVWIAPQGSRRRRVRPPRAPRPEQQLLAELTAAGTGFVNSTLSVGDNVLTVALVESAQRSFAEQRPVALAELAAESVRSD